MSQAQLPARPKPGSGAQMCSGREFSVNPQTNVLGPELCCAKPVMIPEKMGLQAGHSGICLQS